MDITLFLDKIKLALQKRTGSAQKGSGRSYEKWKAKGHIKEPLVTFVVESHNKSLQVCHILPALRMFKDSEIIVIDDGSSLEHTQRLSTALTGANEFMVRANDLYENIMYDKCIRMSNGRYIALLQDDDDIRDTKWVTRAIELFRKYPDMAILGGWDARRLHFNMDEHGGKGYANEDVSHGDFCFAMSVNRAPMWINKELFREYLHHIDYSFTPFQSDDFELCMRAWLKGLKVGWYKLHFPSLSVGGMRLYNNSFAQEMTRRNAEKLYNLYADKEEKILSLVDKANKELSKYVD